jgi:hypothetical protein
MLTEHYGPDLLTAVVHRAIVDANISHLEQDPETSARFASLDAVPPDELRRPVSVSAIADSLGVPFETTRRHVNKLIAAGLCQRCGAGVIVPASALDTPAVNQGAVANMANLRRLFRALKRAGVDFE